MPFLTAAKMVGPSPRALAESRRMTSSEAPASNCESIGETSELNFATNWLETGFRGFVTYRESSNARARSRWLFQTLLDRCQIGWTGMETRDLRYYESETKRELQSLDVAKAPTASARSILLITSTSDMVVPGPPLRGILSPPATSIT